MTIKYIRMWPSMVSSVQCNVLTKGCLLHVSTAKLVTKRDYCFCYSAVFVLLLGAHRTSEILPVHIRWTWYAISCITVSHSVVHQCTISACFFTRKHFCIFVQAYIHGATFMWCDRCVHNAQTPATPHTPASILLGTGLFLVS